MNTKKNIGNPLLVASAVQTGSEIVSRNSDSIIKGAGTAFKIGGVIALVYFGSRTIKTIRKNNLMQRSSSDQNVAAAMDVYQAIPAGYKKGDGSLLNPFGFISDVINKIETIWVKTDRDRIVNCGKKITDLQKCYTVFYQMYGENLRPMLARALTEQDLNSFENLAKTKGMSASNTPVAAAHKFAVVTASSGVRLRTQPIVPLLSTVMYPVGNVVGVVPFGKIVGYTTGVETMTPDNKTIFTQIKAGSKKKMKTNGNIADVVVYAWKGGLEFMTHTEFNAKYGKMTDKWFFFP